MKGKMAVVGIVLQIAAAAALAQSNAESHGPPELPPIIARASEHPVKFSDLPAPRQFITRHETRIRGKSISYTATAGETYITNTWGEPIASFFSFSYVKDDPIEPRRPVTFVFNGGPGSSSLWLHMGVFGPKRVVLDQEVNASNTPPFGARDNPHSVLDVTDLVFIDPVGTGFSHAVGNAKDVDFASVDADADSVARFIELWLSKNGRWNSPKYVVGESYGSVRAALLPRALMGGAFYTQVMRGITLDGIVLLGVTLDAGTSAPPAPSDRPDPTAGLYLPSLAVTAWYHNKIDRAGRSAAQIYDEVKAFGTTDYATALFELRKETLSEEDEKRVAGKLEAYTGISARRWIHSGLRIPMQAFEKQLLAQQGLEVGHYDSRYTLPLAGSGGDPVADDPAMGRYVPGFVAAFNDMIRNDLHVEMPTPYAAIQFALNFKWNYTRAGVPEGQSYAVDLATAMRRTPKLRVLVAAGYYDMVTTPAAAENQIKRGGVPADRVTFKNYESGHMLYLGETAERFANDVRALIDGAPSVGRTRADRP
jgi:carboxypeptidase C (cathepsin A)